MSNLRVVYDNAVDRATLTASTTAGSLAVNNLKTERKSEIWRSTGLIETIKVNWNSPEFVSMVAFPLCSLSSAATIRVRGYSEIDYGGTLQFDTGAQVACAPMDFDVWDWGASPLGVNAYAFGGAAYGVIWFDLATVKSLQIDLDDNTNLSLGYIEASKLVTGTYWSPDENCDYGAQVLAADSSKHERTESGDLKTDRGTLHKVLSFEMGMMTSRDRNALWGILRGNGMSRPMFISLTPIATDATEEQIFQVYGKLSKQSPIKYNYINQYSAPIEIEEI